MKLEIYTNNRELSAHAAGAMVACTKDKPAAVLCLASGDSPKLTYELFAQKVLDENIDISGCFFIGLDEWVGIPPENEGSCHYFLYKYLFEPLQIPASQIHLFNALSNDLSMECAAIDTVIAGKGGIDLMVVGVGMNGHIGFNEPGTAIDNYAHVTELDEVTQTVGQKYFSGPVAINKGITLGLQHFLQSKCAIMLANGLKKAPVIKKALEDPISPNMPATIMRMHANSFMMIDKEAASLLNNGH